MASELFRASDGAGYDDQYDNSDANRYDQAGGYEQDKTPACAAIGHTDSLSVAYKFCKCKGKLGLEIFMGTFVLVTASQGLRKQPSQRGTLSLVGISFEMYWISVLAISFSVLPQSGE